MLRFTSMKKVSFAGNRHLSADGWKCALQSLSAGIEDMDFLSCGLSDEKVNVFPEVMLRFTSMKKVSFRGNGDLSADGWKCALQSLSAGIEDMNFSDCGLTDEKVNVFPE